VATQVVLRLDPYPISSSHSAPTLNSNSLLTPLPIHILTSGSHKLEVKVEGDSMLARLLRKTIGALNTSSDIGVETNNMREWC
jgi:hypothetical protein